MSSDPSLARPPSTALLAMALTAALRKPSGRRGAAGALQSCASKAYARAGFLALFLFFFFSLFFHFIYCIAFYILYRVAKILAGLVGSRLRAICDLWIRSAGSQKGILNLSRGFAAFDSLPLLSAIIYYLSERASYGRRSPVASISGFAYEDCNAKLLSTAAPGGGDSPGGWKG